jgi:hypothetical protein
MQEMHLLPVPTGCKYALMALLVLDCIISLCDVERMLKLWMNLKILYQKCVRTL